MNPVKRIFYNLFFKKKKKNYRKKRRQDSYGEGKYKHTSTPSSYQKTSSQKTKIKYDLTGLRQQVSESEYINNLRIGRSWILPQLVQMGFHKVRGKWVFDSKLFRKAILSKYDISPAGRNAVWRLMKRNYNAIAITNGDSNRILWWNKKVLADIITWDFSLAGNRTSGLNRTECLKIIRSFPEYNSFEELKHAVYSYDKNRMRRRQALYDTPVPESFLDAFEGDGAYNAMINMVKLCGVRITNENGEPLDRDACLSEIDFQASKLSGYQLLEYCKEKFFDSGAFQYSAYMND